MGKGKGKSKLFFWLNKNYDIIAIQKPELNQYGNPKCPARYQYELIYYQANAPSNAAIYVYQRLDPGS